MRLSASTTKSAVEALRDSADWYTLESTPNADTGRHVSDAMRLASLFIIEICGSMLACWNCVSWGTSPSLSLVATNSEVMAALYLLPVKASNCSSETPSTAFCTELNISE